MSAGVVLVTGAAGFIGPKVVELLISQGYHVVVLDALTYAARQDDEGHSLSLRMILQQFGNVESRYTFIKRDVSADPNPPQSASSSEPPPEPIAEIMEKHYVDYIIHMAAETHVDRTIDKSVVLQTEIFGTYRLVEAIAHQNSIPGRHPVKRAVFVGTDEVYGSIDRLSGREGEKWWALSDTEVKELIQKFKFTEDMALAGGSYYAASKGGADLLVKAAFNTYKNDKATGRIDVSRMPVVITRAANNYGPFQHPEKLIPLAICTLLKPDVDEEARRIPVYDRGLAVREWLSTQDHADAIVRFMSEGEAGAVYNIGSGSRCRNRDLLLAVFRACQPFMRHQQFRSLEDACFDATSKDGVARPGHDLCYAIDASAARSFGWTPQALVLEDGIRSVVKWYAENEAWWLPTWTSSGFRNYWNEKYRAILDRRRDPFVFYDKNLAQRPLSETLL